ncbi:uncharacterized protein LOC128892699 [Hylaeus anthracinus]|uniref:uncharacterized protein LOC128892699 n=1 Tax=Hylaeus anthracinus TaxID=313031 RepID=UPI0023BA3213|nr:uncharacterized protein LOC128892699 [Hylaeus anthracinus]
MDELKAYYKLSIFLMSMIGLWPYQNAKLRLFQVCFINISNGYFFIVQVMIFKTMKFTINLLLKNLSTLLMFLGSVVKYNAFWYHSNTIKDFMERTKHDWSTKHEDILKILETRTTAGKYHATCYAIFVLPSALFVTTCHIASLILIKETENGTRTNYFPIMTEYMIDEEKYLYPIVFHQNLSLLICASVFMGTETLYIMWLHHAASLFEISR